MRIKINHAILGYINSHSHQFENPIPSEGEVWEIDRITSYSGVNSGSPVIEMHRGDRWMRIPKSLVGIEDVIEITPRKPQFNLHEYEKNPNIPVVTRCHIKVEISKTGVWFQNLPNCILGSYDAGGETHYEAWDENGKCICGNEYLDLFFDLGGFDFDKETEELWKFIPRRSHAIYDRIREYGLRCYAAGKDDNNSSAASPDKPETSA